MFTPPPSPMPSRPEELKQEDDVPLLPPAAPLVDKRTVGRRYRWTVILAPLALIIITASTRCITHPAAFDVLSEGLPFDWHTMSTKGADWRVHQPHDRRQSVETLSEAEIATTLVKAGSSASSTRVSASTTATATAVPTVPVDPHVPAPFPQPFDSDITQNYSSQTCFDFFRNMTNTPAFRQCRPFSLLLQTSAAFINYQDNLTELNDVVWGICNPPQGFDQCVSNMNWFATAIQDSCAIDIAAENDLALSTLTALKGYGPMFDAACQTDPTTNTYCYVNAVHSSNPSDQYFYQLPLGISVPNTSTPSCSSCTKSVMNVYAAAYPESEALQKTYTNAQKLADDACGNGYAPTVAVSAQSSALSSASSGAGWFFGILLVSLTLFTLH